MEPEENWIKALSSAEEDLKRAQALLSSGVLGRPHRFNISVYISQVFNRKKAWFLQSEKYYYINHEVYYQNIRRLGLEYPELDYDKALPFLLMLPNCLGLSHEK